MRLKGRKIHWSLIDPSIKPSGAVEAGRISSGALYIAPQQLITERTRAASTSQAEARPLPKLCDQSIGLAFAGVRSETSGNTVICLNSCAAQSLERISVFSVTRGNSYEADLHCHGNRNLRCSCICDRARRRPLHKDLSDVGL